MSKENNDKQEFQFQAREVDFNLQKNGEVEIIFYGGDVQITKYIELSMLKEVIYNLEAAEKHNNSRDEKAKAAHDIWAHWMKYMFSICVNTDGDIDAQIPKEKVKQWKRLMNTEFEDLTEQEKKSDYEIADKYLNKL